MADRLNVVLDIDETLIYFIKAIHSKNWCKLSDEDKAKYEYQKNKNNGNIIIFRPHVRKFLCWLFEHCNVYMWTWSDRDYAEDIANLLTNGKKDNIKGFFADQDAERSGKICQGFSHSKDLNYLWYHHPDTKDKLGECNTILIDDLPKNSVHESNMKNSITVNPFALFGEIKDRSEDYTDVSQDRTLLDLIPILDALNKKVKGCFYDCEKRWVKIFDENSGNKEIVEQHMKNIRFCPKSKKIVQAVGVGNSIHFVTGPVQDGGKKYYKTEKMHKKHRIYVGMGGAKYVKKNGEMTKLK